VFIDANTIFWLWPEIILIVVASGIYIGGTWPGYRTSWAQLSILTYVAAGVILLRHEWSLWNTQAVMQSSGPLAIDALGHWVRCVSLLIGVLFTGIYWKGPDRRLTSEFLGTLMMAIAGVMLISRANHLILLFLGLELVSIPTYVLLFVSRSDLQSSESTTKYFFLNILSSAILLYGFSFLYGTTGTMILTGGASAPGMRESLLSQLAAGNISEPLLTIAVVLILGGLGFKIAAAPFHLYAADVYQGTSNVTAGLLSVVPKVAGFIALIRLLAIALPATTDVAWQLLFVMAILTMTVGNVCALWQQNIRRLLAYSSIAHTGYMLIGLAAATTWVLEPVNIAEVSSGSPTGGIAALLLYLFFYSLGTIGIFAALAFLGSDERQVDKVEDLAGLSVRQPLVAASLAICLFSLAGIPPLAGFWGKFMLFTSALSVSSSAPLASVTWCFIILAVIGVLNAAIAAVYYLRLIGVMYFSSSDATLPAAGGQGSRLVMLAATALTLMLGLLPGHAMRSARTAEQVQQGRFVSPSRVIQPANSSDAPEADAP
jgi:NADH-quinone oxidoreductase subunit N